GRPMLSDKPQAVQIVGEHRLLEPAHALIRKLFCQRASLLYAVGPVGIYKQLSIRTNGFADSLYTLQILAGVATDLHFHSRNALIHPADQLPFQLLHRIGCKSTASIHGHALTLSPDKFNQREA